jgi:hypothetical protein
MNKEEILQPSHTGDQRSFEADRKPYQKPKLEKLGDLRSITLGPSIGPPQDSSGGWPANTFF